MAELLEIEDVPDQIRLLEDAAVSFTLENERVQHEATAALLPNMILYRLHQSVMLQV